MRLRRHELPVHWSPLVSRPSRAGLLKAHGVLHAEQPCSSFQRGLNHSGIAFHRRNWKQIPSKSKFLHISNLWPNQNALLKPWYFPLTNFDFPINQKLLFCRASLAPAYHEKILFLNQNKLLFAHIFWTSRARNNTAPFNYLGRPVSLFRGKLGIHGFLLSVIDSLWGIVHLPPLIVNVNSRLGRISSLFPIRFCSI